MCHSKQNITVCIKKPQVVFFTLSHVQENLSVLAIQSVYDASMPHPCKDVVRGEILPSAWILEPDVVNGREITRVIYMAQVRFCGMSNSGCKKLLHFRGRK